MTPTLYRCQLDGRLVRMRDLDKHLGHRVTVASGVSPWEFVLYHYWRLTNQL